MCKLPVLCPIPTQRDTGPPKKLGFSISTPLLLPTHRILTPLTLGKLPGGPGPMDAEVSFDWLPVYWLTPLDSVSLLAGYLIVFQALQL